MGRTQAATIRTGQALEQTAARSSQSVSRMGTAMAAAGSAIMLGVGAGLAISAKAAIDFESSFAGIRKTVDASETQFAALAGSIRQLATEIPVSVNELNRIGELGGQLGIQARNIDEFTETVAKLGVTTVLGSEAAALGLARLHAVMGEGEGTFDRTGSAIVELGNTFATTEDQILTFAQRIAPVGSIMGLTTGEVLGLAAAMSELGIPAERGGTAIQRVFLKMREAADEGGEAAENWAKVVGLSVEDFVELVRTDAAQAFALMAAGLNRVEESGGSAVIALRELGLTNQRDIGALLAAASGHQRVADGIEAGNRARRENIALEEEAAKRFETTASKIQLALNQLYDLRIEIGEKLLPVIGDLAEDVATLLKLIPEWADENQTLIKILGRLALAITSVTIAFKVLTGLKIVAGIRALSTALVGATGAASALAGVLSGGLAVALGLVALKMGDVIRKRIEYRQVVDDIVAALEDEAEGHRNAAREAALATLDPETLRVLRQEAGLSRQTIADAMFGEPEDWEKIVSAIDKAEERLRVLREEESRALAQEPGFLDPGIEELVRERETASKSLFALKEAAKELGITYDQVAEARERFAEAQAEEVQQRGLELLTGEMSDYLDLSWQAIRRTMGLTDAHQELTDAIEEEVDALEVLNKTMTDGRADALGYVDAAISLSDAMAAFDEEPTIENFLRLADAYNAVQSSAAGLENGLAPLTSMIQDMTAAGFLSNQEAARMLALFSIVPGATGAAASSIASFTIDLGLLEAAAEAAGITVAELLGIMYGVSSAAGQTIYNMLQVATAADALGKQLRGGFLGDLSGALLGRISTALRRVTSMGLGGFAGAFRRMGEQFGGEFADGVAGGAGGAADAIEDVADRIIDRVGIVANSIQALFSHRRSLRAVTDAERDLADLREEHRTIAERIADAEARLREERRKSAEITAREALAIEEAEDALMRARIAYEQGRITAAELAVAEQELQEARDDATAQTDEEIAAQEELEELRRRAAELPRLIAEAEEDLVEAQLAVVDAFLQLNAAGREWLEMGPELVETFRKIAQAAGLSPGVIGNLIGIGTPNPVFTHPIDWYLRPAGGRAPSEMGGTYTVQMGDTLSSIARHLNYPGGWEALFEKNRNLLSDPNVIFPGQVLRLHRGGIVPPVDTRWTPPGEVPAFLRPGEIVLSDPDQLFRLIDTRYRRYDTPFTNLRSLTLNVQGVWDFRRRDAIEGIMDQVEKELLRRQRRSGTSAQVFS